MILLAQGISVPWRSAQRFDELLGVGSENRAVFHLAGMGLQSSTFVARNDVEVQVKDSLAGSRFVELGNIDAVGVEGFLGGVGDLLHDADDMRERRRIGIEKVARRLLRQDQRMA